MGNFFSDGIRDLLNQLLSSIPYILKAILIFIIGWMIAKFVSRLAKKFLIKLKVDKLGKKLNEIDLISNSSINIVPSTIFSKALYYFLYFVFLIAAVEALQIEAVSEMLLGMLAYIPILISAILVFIIGLFVADALKKLVFTTASSLGIPTARLISNLFFYFIFINILMISLSQAGINMDLIQDNISILLGGIVLAFALGYGLASKALAANFISFFYNKENIELGKVVAVDGKKGKVIEVGSTTFTLETESSQIIIPLSKLTTNTVEVFE